MHENLAVVSTIMKSKLTGYEKLCEKVHELEIVSGFKIEELVNLFAAGYTLTPPKPQKTIVDQMICEKLSKSATVHLNKVLSKRAGRRVL